MTEDTSAYWRKLLGVDEPVNPAGLDSFHSPCIIFRPLLFFLFGLASRFFFPLKGHGLENLPAGPVMITPNHASFLDYPCVAYLMGKRSWDVYAIATKKYVDNPFDKFFMLCAAHVIRIDAEADFFTALRAAAGVLRSGHSVTIFPEGTRSKDGELQPFKVGVGTLAVEANVKMVPVYIKGTKDILPRGGRFLKRGKVEVYFGKPIDPAPFIEKKKVTPAYDVYKEITDELRNRVAELRDRSSSK